MLPPQAKWGALRGERSERRVPIMTATSSSNLREPQTGPAEAQGDPSAREEETRVNRVDQATGDLLPSDCALLPLRAGRLLVSRSHALFCRVDAPDVPAVEQVLDGAAGAETLPERLRQRLERHGFGGPPRVAKPPSPSVQIQLTNACNLACSYCCTNSGEARATELDRQRLFALVDDVREVLGPGTRLGLLGGEPLLVPWAIDLAEHVVDRQLRLTVFTNGLLLVDDDNARRLAALIQRRAEVRVSLAGPNGQLCDRMSGAPRFEQVISGIHNLARHGGKPHIDLMLYPDHIDEISETLPELRKLLPPQTRIALGVLYLSGREQGEHLFVSRSELERALDRIAFEAGETIAAPQLSPLADRREGCTCALGHHLHVRSDGALFTCFKMEEQVGDLARQEFAATLRELRSKARPVDTLPYCQDCALSTLCGGGCRTENLQYTGDADEPICGPWRVAVLSELLAEDGASALEWPATHLLAEAQLRGIEAPEELTPVVPSRHLIDT